MVRILGAGFPIAVLVVSTALTAATQPQPASSPSPEHGAIRAALTDEEFREFERWVAIGAGGLPHTLEGYRTLQRLNRMLRDPLDLSHLDAAIGATGDLATLKALPLRQGTRPAVAPFAIPHRQMSAHAGPDVRARQKEVFDEVVARHSTAVHYQRSYFEQHNEAVFLKSPALGNATAVPDTHGEIGHIHPSDGSMHFSLSPSDTRELVSKGWGELHGLAGQVYQPGRRLPATYTMVYSPRTTEDLIVIRHVLEAAIAFSSVGTSLVHDR